MRKSLTERLAAAWLAAAIAAPASAAVPIDQLSLEMDPLDAKVLFKKDVRDKSTFPVSIVQPDGPRLTGRIEVKGSFTRNLEKKSLLIKLDGGQTWRGQRRISLNAMATDGSMMREWLAWGLIHALGMAAPEVRYTRLSMNGRHSGLFLWIQWIDPVLFSRLGLGGDGEFYHPIDAAFCGNLSLSSARDAERCWFKLSPRDGNFRSLRQWAVDIHQAAIPEFDTFIDRTMDAESLVNWISVIALTSNSDSYNKNYFLYRVASSGRWLVVPWDFDLSFGRTFDPFEPFPRSLLNDNFQYYYPLALGQPNPLRNKALKNEVVRERVRRRIGELVGEAGPTKAKPWRGWFSTARMQRQIDELDKVVSPELGLDPFLVGQRGRYEQEVGALRHYVDMRVRHLEQVVIGTPTWSRDQASAPLPRRGGRVTVFDGWGFLLAALDVQQGGGRGSLDVRVRRGRPELAPTGISRSACVRRAWILNVEGTRGVVEADVLLEYLDETSNTRELGSRVADEWRLRLFQRTRDGWNPLETRVNTLANTLRTTAVRFPAGEPQWFLACVPSEGGTTAAAGR